VVISQLANPDTPCLWRSPAIFDFRYETTPWRHRNHDAQLRPIAKSEKPRHADQATWAERRQATGRQAGLETGIGAMLGGRSPGSTAFRGRDAGFRRAARASRNWWSITRSADDVPAARGISRARIFPPSPFFRNCWRDKHLLIADHTRASPAPARSRSPAGYRSRQPCTLARKASRPCEERASREVERLIRAYTPSRLPDGRKAELTKTDGDPGEALRNERPAVNKKVAPVSCHRHRCDSKTRWQDPPALLRT